MYLYVRNSGNKFWSQESPTKDDLYLIKENLLCVYYNYGGTFIQVNVVNDKAVYAEVDTGVRLKNVETEEVYTLSQGSMAGLIESGRWQVVPPQIPIGPSGHRAIGNEAVTLNTRCLIR